MDKPIEKLIHTDTPTKKMLQELVDRKQKYEQVQKQGLFWRMITIILSFLFLTYLYIWIYLPYKDQFDMILKEFFDRSFHLVILLMIGGSYGATLFYKKKEDKKEKEFHELRCEIIDKSTDLWNDDDAWREREKVFEMMKRVYDINLYFESK